MLLLPCRFGSLAQPNRVLPLFHGTAFSRVFLLFQSYLYTRGVQEWMLGVFRAASALSGIGATLLTPMLIRRLGMVRAGWWTLALQLGMLVPAVFTFAAPGSTAAVYLFLVFLCASRMGLWGFDLCEVQIMQEGVEEEARGAVNGVEHSLTNLFMLLSFVLGIIVPDPRNFVALVIVSLAMVALAMVVYVLWTRTPAAAELQAKSTALASGSATADGLQSGSSSSLGELESVVAGTGGDWPHATSPATNTGVARPSKQHIIDEDDNSVIRSR